MQAAREAARRAQCVNNLKQLGLAAHNYLSSNNCFPLGDMYPAGSSGTTTNAAYRVTGNGGNSWSYGWTVCILPNIEQQALYNAYNFSFSYCDPPSCGFSAVNTTVGYTQIASYLCPSDNITQRAAPPWGSLGYMGNWGGPGEIRCFTGIIISNYWGDTGVGAQTGAIGVQSVTDGTSQTAMFSERLVGIYGNPVVYPSASSDSKRAVFKTSVTVNVAVNATTTTVALLAACKSLPSSTASVYSAGAGRLWTVGFPWYFQVNKYSHVGTPNTLMCLATNTNGGNDGSIYDSVPPTSNHAGGVNVCMADGSVKFIKDSISQEAWWAIGTRASGEAISADAF